MKSSFRDTNPSLVLSLQKISFGEYIIFDLEENTLVLGVLELEMNVAKM